MQPNEETETIITADSRRPLNPVDPQTSQDHGQGQDQDQDLDLNQGDVEDASHYEQTHVHEVYDAIADHFSATRYAPWPLVAQFLAAQPAGSIGLDIGCGNGKYLSGASGAPPSSTPSSPSSADDPQLFILGSDRSPALAKFAYEKHAQHQVGADVLLADSLALPFRDRCADFIICIAMVHHLSTRARRQAAIKELLRCVRWPEVQQQQQPQPPTASSSQTPPAPTAATTGTPTPSLPPSSTLSSSPTTSSPSSSPFLSGRVLLYVWALEQASSRRGWAAGGEQDLLVPWVKTMRDKNKSKSKNKDKDKGTKDKKQEEGGYNNDEEGKKDQEAQQPHVPPTFHRYYHLYKQGELEDDVAVVGGRVVASGYEKDNWWVVADPL